MSTTADRTPTRHTAGVFDIRTIIGTLLGIYGIILTAMGLLGDPAYDRTGGVNANLIAGIALLVAGLVFLAWAKARPVVVDERELARGDDGNAVHEAR
ncbi:hypothetical protein [Mobilicoccus pelagius]|uniref:Uncharacterized protein n=1 Tax=Mobilicoccus pelagius NBRC 104925 TaxID=1089455 RepID=H5URF5_9MICO|nr:hypothetical protein [Mobilicoccus pelagius]GAB48313.1 hypothetical protein MOPEL_071_00280 [Mobilicoccus pelagius NBRC 104925]